MALTAGSRLGPYEIVGLLGAGGMGEVYKATDTRLNRTVAIKVLPADLATDVERRQRFEREARLVASLNHPHICAVHDVGSQSIAGGEPVSYLVMEYLEGETLAERLTRGPLPLGETIRLGAAIATALAAAHREQIVHRDLKPANVMLTKSGLKLLDFGIAKAVHPVAQGGTMMSTKALTVATMPGTTVGTLPYMSPEQLEGRPVDARSDMFALGAVLFEMATGTRAFRGDSYAALASSILTSTPPPIAASPPLDRIVRTCLEKDPDRRWQSAHDVALQLAAAGEREAAAADRPRRAVQWLPWAIALAAIAAVAAVWLAGRRAEPVTTSTAAFGRVVKLQVPPPPEPSVFSFTVESPSMAVSPDGSRVALSVFTSKGEWSLWVRALDSLDGQVLEGTEGSTSMFWSPDGRSIGFFARGKLKRLDLASGSSPVPICDVQQDIGQMGTWGADGTILIASIEGKELRKVQATGGTATTFLTPDPQRNERRVTAPVFLPDGRSFLYMVGLSDDSGAVMLARPDSPPRELVKVKSNAQYVEPGYLLYVQERTLVARRFDASTGEVRGDPISVATPVAHFLSTGQAHFSASATGVIAYQPHENVHRLVSFDRSGRELATLRPLGEHLALRLSADGRQLLFDRIDRSTTTFNIHLLELDRGVETQVTTDRATEVYPMWAGGDAIVYSSARGRAPRLHRHFLSSGRVEAIGPDVLGLQQPSDVSRDSQWLLYAQRSPRGDYDVHTLNLADGRDVPLRNSTFNETDGRFSPDGRHVAFVSSEGGTSNVYVIPFQAGGQPRAVSSGGGRAPRWSRDGRELLYIARDDGGFHVTSVATTFTPALTFGESTRLFTLPHGRAWSDFVQTPDGRLIAVEQLQFMGRQPVTIIVNWPVSLER